MLSSAEKRHRRSKGDPVGTPGVSGPSGPRGHSGEGDFYDESSSRVRRGQRWRSSRGTILSTTWMAPPQIGQTLAAARFGASAGGSASSPSSIRHRAAHCLRQRLAIQPYWRRRTKPLGRTCIRKRRINSCRGRDASHPTPPAQNRTCATHAYGFHLGCSASNRSRGYGCKT